MEIRSGSELILESDKRLDTCGHKGIASLCEDLHEVVREVAACQVKAHDGMGQCIAFIDGDVMSDTIPWIQDDAYGQRGYDRWKSFLSHLGPVPNDLQLPYFSLAAEKHYNIVILLLLLFSIVLVF